MVLEVLNENFIRQGVVDGFESIIWTDRYNSYGDFELYLPLTIENKNLYKHDYYLVNDLSDYTMIIDNVRLTTDIDEGAKLVITGRSLESILFRRIVWYQTTVSGNLQNAVKKLITENILNPLGNMVNRKIENFVFEESTDPLVTDLNIQEMQFTGDTLYDAISKICDVHDLGFRILLNENKEFVFSLYYGKDRSHAQHDRPFVEFSPEFDNIIDSDFYVSQENYSNFTLIAGEGTGSSRFTTTYGDNESTGIRRREYFTDARDLSKTNQANGQANLSDDQYRRVLQARGADKLKREVNIKRTFEGQVDTSQIYKYNENFFMGDIVQLGNGYGDSATSRVVEYIYSVSGEGVKLYPTFRILEEEE
jgi:hypothetical protein